MRTTEASLLVAACGAALLLAGAAQAGEWTYDSEKGHIPMMTRGGYSVHS